MNQRKFNIWFGAILLLTLLATCYLAVDAIYRNAPPTMPDGYIVSVLSPQS